MSAPHCEWCADPWRAVLIDLVRQGIFPAVIVRHYGLRPTSVVGVLEGARQRECLPHPTCRYCPVRVSSRQVTCGKAECNRRRERDNRRLWRARFGNQPHERQTRTWKEPPGFIWPELPPNPRERTERQPRPQVAVPIRFPAFAVGLGRSAPVSREAAMVQARDMLQRESAPYARPTLAEVLSIRPRQSAALNYLPPPPLCPRIGSLHVPSSR